MARAFVGPLCRFHAAPDGDAARLRPGVEAWRAVLHEGVAAKVREQLQWDEGAGIAEWFDLGEAGWLALKLFAFYAERSDLEMPDTVPALLELDREYRAASDGKFERSLYGQLLACSAWLPGDFPVTLRAPLPDGEVVEFGSVAVLSDQLKWLNARTFQADAATLASWATLPAPAGGPLLDAARRGLSGMVAAVDLARRHRLPIVLREV